MAWSKAYTISSKIAEISPEESEFEAATQLVGANKWSHHDKVACWNLARALLDEHITEIFDLYQAFMDPSVSSWQHLL